MVSAGSKKKRVAVIGAGLQANRRLPAIQAHPKSEVSLIIDIVPSRAKRLAEGYGCPWGTDWTAAVKDKKIDSVVVLTYPDTHAAISRAALRAGKDVLCEKPLTRTEAQARQLVALAKSTGRILKCGFNHRHHPAIAEAYRLFQAGTIGRALFGRGRYGIGGRRGLATEWRSDPNIVSGGQLMEQGIHLVDLFRWFLGEFRTVTGMIATSHWPIAPLEDNGFALLTSRRGVIVSLHSSLTQWTNLFEFELYGARGSVTVTGLGGSYSVEQLRISRHDPDQPFSHQTIEFRGADESWTNEWQEFMAAVISRRSPLGNGTDGLKALQLVNAVYRAARTGRIVMV